MWLTRNCDLAIGDVNEHKPMSQSNARQPSFGLAHWPSYASLWRGFGRRTGVTSMVEVIAT